MKKYQVLLSKSYIVEIFANSEAEADKYTTFFISDVKDVSTDDERQKYAFSIEDIECTGNETFGVTEIAAQEREH